jgi:hypothetical protein
MEQTVARHFSGLSLEDQRREGRLVPTPPQACFVFASGDIVNYQRSEGNMDFYRRNDTNLDTILSS